MASSYPRPESGKGGMGVPSAQAWFAKQISHVASEASMRWALAELFLLMSPGFWQHPH